MRTKKMFNSVLTFFLVFAAVLFAGQRGTVAEAAGKDRLYYFNMDANGTQGNLILVETDGHWGLLDTGHRYAATIKDESGRTISVPQSTGLSSQIYMRNGKDVANYMINRLGVTHLDFIVGTHAHSDHIGGVPEIASTSFKDAAGRTRYLVDSYTTYYYKDYQHISDFEDDLSTYSDNSWHNQAFAYQAEKTMQARGATMVDVSKSQVVHGDPGNAFGDYVSFEVGNMSFRLYNVHEYTNTRNENVNSIVTVMTNGDYTVVNLADLNTNKGAIDKTSQAISKDYGGVDVVVAGHHGYAGSNTKTMFDSLQPDYVVVSNGSAEDSWLYTDCDLAAAMPYAKSLFGTSFYSTGISPYAVVTDLSGKQVYVYKLEGNGKLTDAFYQSIKATKKTGWVSWVNTGETLWSYLENGTPKKNTWQKIDGKMYHFDSTGIMDTGWLADGKETHYMDASGALVTGWRMIDNKWYYFEP
ncbi:MAG: MBL fold metallo-hydrolase, partial [Bacteroidales bacterium]|nr:MBL fold metallo-hydrolase [Bacteroidales bacterium]